MNMLDAFLVLVGGKNLSVRAFDRHESFRRFLQVPEEEVRVRRWLAKKGPSGPIIVNRRPKKCTLPVLGSR